MTKSDFNNSVFVVKVYEHTKPLIVEVFPATEQGVSDAHQYYQIMERTGKLHNHLFVNLLIYSANH